MLAVGTGVIVTIVETGIAGQPPEAGIVYVTVYVPGELALGIMVPVLISIDKPAGDAEYDPPVYAAVPVNVTGCGVELFTQNESAG